MEAHQQTEQEQTDIIVDKQIQWLNATVFCTLALSQIHRIGVFALRDIKKGQKLYCSEFDRIPLKIPYSRFDEIREEIRDIIIQRHASVVDGSYFISPNNDTLLISFMNHSDNPNFKDDIAIKDIDKGQEILEDYGKYTKICGI